MRMDLPVIQTLLASDEPAVVYRTRVDLLDESPDTPEVKALHEQIRTCERVEKLLAHRRAGDPVPALPEPHAYQKWQGPLWTLQQVAGLGYPPGDRSLAPLLDRFYAWLFSEHHMQFPHTLVIPGQEDRVRRCAVQEANAAWYAMTLGLADERSEELIRRIRKWQWPDGGWNCDKRPEARKSSFIESIAPLRALALHARLLGSAESRACADRAAELFLSRRLFRRLKDGSVISPDYLVIPYPYYYHYNILYGLKVMAEGGYLRDERCAEALDLLQARRLPDGGFACEERLYKVSDQYITRGSFVDWGPVGRKRMNPWVTLDALWVLKQAGRV